MKMYILKQWLFFLFNPKNSLAGGVRMARQLLFWNAQAETVSHAATPAAAALRCAARQLHTLSRRPVSVWQKRKKKKTSSAVGLRAQRACAAAAVMAARESEEDNKWTAGKRLEGEERGKGDKFVLLFSRPTATLSRTLLSCQRWDTWLLGLSGVCVRACARVCLFVLLWGMWLGFWTTRARPRCTRTGQWAVNGRLPGVHTSPPTTPSSAYVPTAVDRS